MTLLARTRPDRSTERKRDVLCGFMRRVGITDLLVIIWAVLGAQLIRFAPGASEAALPVGSDPVLGLGYTTLTVVLIIAWLLGLVSSYTMGGFIHILLVVAIILILVRIIQGNKIIS